MIPTLNHYCDIVSDIPFGSVYLYTYIYILNTHNIFYSDILSGNIWHSFWHVLWRFLSDILFGIYSDILSGILWHYFWHSIWHLFWHSIWHLLNHLFWHSFWHMFFSLTFYLAYVYGISSDIFSGIISDMSSQLLCGRGPAIGSLSSSGCCSGAGLRGNAIGAGVIIEGIQFQKPTLMWYNVCCLIVNPP